MESYSAAQAQRDRQAGSSSHGQVAIDLTTEPDEEPAVSNDVYNSAFAAAERKHERSHGHDEKRQKTQATYEAQNGDGIEITSSKYPASSGHHYGLSAGVTTPQASGPHFGYPSFQPPPFAGPSNYASNGSNQSNAIDLTNRLSPPPAPPQPNIDRKPLCIGSVHSKVTMLYPSPAVVVGQDVTNNRENLMVVPFHGAEMLKVKLKLRAAGAPLRETEPVATANQDVVQVLSPASSIYIGELDQGAQKIFTPLLQRGLIRLEGFVQRIHPDAHQYQATIFVLVFTLPSNVMFIANHLASHHCYLIDPMPSYDPSRHNEAVYDNAHKDYYVNPSASARYGGATQPPWGGPTGATYGQTKVNTVEVQREQVDEVFKSLKDDMKLAETEPGPHIKTKLFSHQKQALTFLREEEREPAAIEAAMIAQLAHAAKLEQEELVKAEESGVSVVDRDGKPQTSIPKYRKRDRGKEDWMGRSLWETHKDEVGKVLGYKNRITGESHKAHKEEGRPVEGRGAILADDMGLGKTLSIVSLIASTLETARDFASGEVVLPPAPKEVVALSDNKEGLSAAHFAGKVHGMPQTEFPEAENTETAGRSKHKKRKHELEEDKQRSSYARRSRIAQRTRATLLVCPLSTVSNWEDQIKEHWDGEVYVVGGAAGVAPPKKPAATWAGRKKEPPADVLTDGVLRVYIYHGNSRRPDPEFISNFDVVITTFSTLATEFSKLRQVSTDQDESPTPTEDGSDNGMAFDVDGAGVPMERSNIELEAAALEATTKGRGKGKASEKLGPKAACEAASPLQSLEWFRVVLDEAHFIKESSTVASRAACYLEAERRIALTGTPIQNKLDDVWALFKFLRLAPLDERSIFVDKVLSLCKSGNQVGLARLQLIMRSCTLRRTKDMTGENGKKILELPERKEYQQWLTFRDDERQIYDSIKTEVAKKVDELKKQKQLGKNYATVLQEAMRLRQICDHVDLIKSGAVEEDYDGTVMDYDVAVAGIEANGLNQARGVSIIAYLKDTDAARCSECDTELADRFPSLTLGDDDLKPEEERPDTDVKGKRVKRIPNPILTKCQHLFCLACFKKAVCPTYPKNIKGVGRPCSACNRGLRLQYDALEIAPPGTQDDMPDTAPARPPRKRYQRPPGEKPTLSTKMQYLLEKLMASSRVNKHSKNYDISAFAQLKPEEFNPDGSPIEIKTVVFSQWTTMLDRIGDMLEECQIKYARLDGTMTRDDRSAAMLALKADPATEVLLVSIRAGGVGLNLVTASRCFIMEPYWNPSVEAQAIDRIHRMGQTKPVEAIKLMMNDSIEVKMSERQKKKNSLAKLTLKGMSKAELLERRMEELVELFS